VCWPTLISIVLHDPPQIYRRYFTAEERKTRFSPLESALSEIDVLRVLLLRLSGFSRRGASSDHRPLVDDGPAPATLSLALGRSQPQHLASSSSHRSPQPLLPQPGILSELHPHGPGRHLISERSPNEEARKAPSPATTTPRHGYYLHLQETERRLLDQILSPISPPRSSHPRHQQALPAGARRFEGDLGFGLSSLPFGPST
jgi:hypothetical protein